MTETEKKPATKSKPDHYIWTPEAQFDQILEEMQEIAGQPGRRIEVRGTGSHTTFTVKCATYTGDPINKSHVCPPDCPG
jgi:hypothetical protein